MLAFGQTDTSAELILTLTEKVSIADANYLFVFTHVLTKDVVAFVKLETEDESNYKTRYNKFTINPSEVFEDQQPGEWHYKIYEQASSVNTDPASSGAVLEYGKLMFDRSPEFSFTKYDQATSFKTYNG